MSFEAAFQRLLRLSHTRCFLRGLPRSARPAWVSFPAGSSSAWTARFQSHFLQPQTGHTQWASAARKTPFSPGACVPPTSTEISRRGKWSKRSEWIECQMSICIFLSFSDKPQSHLSTVINQHWEGAEAENTQSTKQLTQTLHLEGTGVLKGQSV